MKTIDIKDFKQIRCKIGYEEIIKDYADKSVKLLKLYSPKRSFKRPNNYSSTWTTKEDGSLIGHKLKNKVYGVTVWNEKNYRLTHLLENGHLIVNKKGGVGWASANPHIDRVYRNLKEPFVNAMERANIDVEFW